MSSEPQSPPPTTSEIASDIEGHSFPASSEAVFDPKVQEAVNLRLTEEKLRQELSDLRRPYIFRNSQLLTALITSVGAIIGVFLLVEDNYFKIREQRNAFQEEQTLRLDAEAKDASDRATVAKREAAAINEAAETTKADSIRIVQDADVKISTVNAALATARDKLAALTRDVSIRQHANRAEEFVVARDGTKARVAALEAWNMGHTRETRQAVVHAYSLPIAVLGGDTLFHTNFAFSPNGSQIAIASNGQATVWDTATGRKALKLDAVSHIESVIFSPDGDRIATGDEDGKLVVWNVANGKPLMTIRGGTASAKNLAYSSDGKRLLTTDMENISRVWELESGKRLVQIEAMAGPFQKTIYSPDGRRVVTQAGRLLTSPATYMTMVWDATTGKQISEMAGDVLALSPDLRRAIRGSNKPAIVDLVSGVVLATLEIHAGKLDTASFSPDGRSIVGSGNSDGLCIWNAVTGKQVVEIAGKDESPLSAVFSPDGRRLVTATAHTASVLDTSNWTRLARYDFEGLFVTTAMSPDDRSLVIQTPFATEGTVLYRVVSPDDVDRDFPSKTGP